jgi:enterochelin esterase family protein
MTKAAVIAPVVLLFWGAIATAQDSLTVNQPIEREIAPGTAHSYTIYLNAGEYVAGWVDQRGIVTLAVAFLPDGSRLRAFAGPPEGKRQFAIVAETAGLYRLEVRAPTTTEAVTAGRPIADKGKYELQVTEKLSLDERLKPGPRQDRYSSPTIEALRKQLAQGEKSTESFWRKAAESGTPLVEPIEKNDKYVLVTFLWRGTPDTRNVLVVGSFWTRPMTEYVMTQLGGSDVWYLTLRMPGGARFAYALSPNDPLASDGPRAMQRMATTQSDPLNPRRWFCGAAASRYECQSLAELPGAPPQPWIVRNSQTPTGTIDKHTIKSERLKNERNLSVYVPPNYRRDARPYALLVLFDEGAYLNNVPTPVILDNLIAASKIPPTIAVLIANPSQETRGKELPPNPDFADFLAKELIPWVRDHYNVTRDPRHTVVGGSSYGGIAATYAGLRHPDVFGNVLCQSGSFWWAPDRKIEPDMDATIEPGWLAKEFIKSPKLPLKFWMDAGVFEVDPYAGGGAILEPSRHMRDVLLAKGYEVHYQQFISGHDYLNWRGTLADGLIALIGRRESSSR